MSNTRGDWISLDSGGLSAEIDPVGAQLSTLRSAAGLDLLWNGDPSIWSGRAPLLFPIVGALAGGAYRLGSATYDMSRHGFARGTRFDLIDSDRANALFRLTATDDTLRKYPFRFELDVHYGLEGTTLTVTALIRNLGPEDMPASFGFHPGFAWPLPFGRPREAHFIEFESAEPAPVRRLNRDGLLAPDLYPTPVEDRCLRLEDALFRDDALIFDAVRSRALTYGAEAGPRLRLSFPDTPYLGVWTKPGAPFICIEPWHGIADPAGFSGDFRDKPGILRIAPSAAEAATLTVSLRDGGA